MRNKTLGFVTALALWSTACTLDQVGPEEASADLTADQDFFEATQVESAIEADPNVVFLIDLRADEIYTFDQHIDLIDFSHFMVQCPSMEHPIPMEDFAQIVDLNLNSNLWSMWSSSADTFRTAVKEFCDDDGGDCVIVDDDSGWENA